MYRTFNFCLDVVMLSVAEGFTGKEVENIAFVRSAVVNHLISFFSKNFFGSLQGQILRNIEEDWRNPVLEKKEGVAKLSFEKRVELAKMWVHLVMSLRDAENASASTDSAEWACDNARSALAAAVARENTEKWVQCKNERWAEAKGRYNALVAKINEEVLPCL